MKRLMVVLPIFAIAAITFASSGFWSENKKPAISLADAVNLATGTLNKDGSDFYCLSGSITVSGNLP